MSQVKLISKEDFSKFVPIGANVDTDIINVHIDDAERFVMQVQFPTSMISDIKSYFEEPIKAWSRTTPYSMDNVVRHEDGFSYFWISTSIANTGNEPENNSPVWSKVELLNFFENYLKPYWICCAAANFLTWHGVNVTQYGLRNPLDDTSENVSDKMRAELVNSIQAKSNHYKTQINYYLDQVQWTFDGTTYVKNDNTRDDRKAKFKIIQV